MLDDVNMFGIIVGRLMELPMDAVVPIGNMVSSREYNVFTGKCLDENLRWVEPRRERWSAQPRRIVARPRPRYCTFDRWLAKWPFSLGSWLYIKRKKTCAYAR